MNVIEVQELGKLYRLGKVGGGSFAEDFHRFVLRMTGKSDPYADMGEVNDRAVKGKSDYVWALKNISFNVAAGEVVGIIGRNGAGKSTLLKLLSRVAEPSAGSFRIKGRVASLLEVGTGFHPDLSGRENIYLNGAILGMSKKQIGKSFDAIIDFAGIERYIDTPIKRYSSGMKVRLGFAVAAHLDPEILIVDEVLAVGDAEFQNKCISKMQDVAGGGRTILFVSHNLSAVRNLCTRGIVIDHGQMAFDGTVHDAINAYRSSVQTDQESGHTVIRTEIISEPFQFTRAELIDKNSEPCDQFEVVDNVRIRISIRMNAARHDSIIGIILEDSNGSCIFVSTNDENTGQTFLGGLQPGDHTVYLTLPSNILKPGNYWISLSARGKEGKPYHRLENCLTFEVKDTVTYRGMKNMYRRQALVAPLLTWSLGTPVEA
jgi:lipopolysaccharide transport system ATP-binding protein